MARVYATPTQYEDLAEEPWDGTPRQLTARLQSASTEVDTLTRFSRFDVDDNGYPTDPAVVGAFAEATCAIVEHWADTDDPRGVDASQGAVKIGSVSIGTTSADRSAMTDHDKLTARIGDRAINILANAGLISARVAHT